MFVENFLLKFLFFSLLFVFDNESDQNFEFYTWQFSLFSIASINRILLTKCYIFDNIIFEIDDWYHIIWNIINKLVLIASSKSFFQFWVPIFYEDYERFLVFITCLMNPHFEWKIGIVEA